MGDRENYSDWQGPLEEAPNLSEPRARLLVLLLERTRDNPFAKMRGLPVFQRLLGALRLALQRRVDLATPWEIARMKAPRRLPPPRCPRPRP